SSSGKAGAARRRMSIVINTAIRSQANRARTRRCGALSGRRWTALPGASAAAMLSVTGDTGTPSSNADSVTSLIAIELRRRGKHVTKMLRSQRVGDLQLDRGGFVDWTHDTPS